MATIDSNSSTNNTNNHWVDVFASGDQGLAIWEFLPSAADMRRLICVHPRIHQFARKLPGHQQQRIQTLEATLGEVELSRILLGVSLSELVEEHLWKGQYHCVYTFCDLSLHEQPPVTVFQEYATIREDLDWLQEIRWDNTNDFDRLDREDDLVFHLNLYRQQKRRSRAKGKPDDDRTTPTTIHHQLPVQCTSEFCTTPNNIQDKLYMVSGKEHATRMQRAYCWQCVTKNLGLLIRLVVENNLDYGIDTFLGSRCPRPVWKDTRGNMIFWYGGGGGFDFSESHYLVAGPHHGELDVPRLVGFEENEEEQSDGNDDEEEEDE